MKSVFPLKNIIYNFRSASIIQRNRVATTKHGLQTVPYIAAQLWDKLPTSIKLADTLQKFSLEMEKLPSVSCSCRLCAPCIPQLGYI